MILRAYRTRTLKEHLFVEQAAVNRPSSSNNNNERRKRPSVPTNLPHNHRASLLWRLPARSLSHARKTRRSPTAPTRTPTAGFHFATGKRLEYRTVASAESGGCSAWTNKASADIVLGLDSATTPLWDPTPPARLASPRHPLPGRVARSRPAPCCVRGRYPDIPWVFCSKIGGFMDC